MPPPGSALPFPSIPREIALNKFLTALILSAFAVAGAQAASHAGAAPAKAEAAKPAASAAKAKPAKAAASAPKKAMKKEEAKK